MADAAENPDACSRCRRTFEHLHVFQSRPSLQFCADCAAELLAAGGVAKFEKTIADELREAAARLRKIGSKVVPGRLPGEGPACDVCTCGSRWADELLSDPPPPDPRPEEDL